jgi:hypothetical protein
MLKHGVMAAGEWHNQGPQDLITLPLCIQIAIDEIQLCLLSVAYACPHHNPSMGHCSQCCHEQTARTHNAIHVVYGCEAGWT